MSMLPGASAALLDRLIDDAAIFPPGNAALGDALPAHREHLASWYGSLVGPFLCADRELGRFEAVLGAGTAEDPDPLQLGLIVTAGAGAIEPAVARAATVAGTRLVGVEVALRSDDDLVANARRVASVLDAQLPDGVVGSIEVPRLPDPARPGAGWLSALDVVAEAGHRLKYRTGGSEPAEFPSELELATVLDAALDRELPVKCTAGLHSAVRHTAPESGFEEHGFLNVLLATGAGLDGADAAGMAAILANRDRDDIREQTSALAADEAARIRRWFTSYGSCSILEPVDDLVELGLLSREAVGA